MVSEEGLAVERDTRGSDQAESGACGVDSEKNEAECDESSEDCPTENTTATPETENAKETNVASSSIIENSPSLENSFTDDDDDDSSDKNARISGILTAQDVIFSPSWSESLKSPTDLLGFSPSETGSRHGLGKRN